LPGLALVVAMAALTYLWLGPPPSSTTFDVFSIDRPASDERLPLGASQTWMLEGRLQLASGAPASGGAPTIDVVEAVALLEATLQVRRDRPQFRPPDLEPQRFRTLFAGQYPRLRQHRRHRVSAFRYLHRHALILGLTRTRQVPRRDCHAARKSYPDPVCRFELSLRVR
jgi:hypothetical protein